MLQATQGETAGATVTICQEELESLLAREWLLTNSRGSYASGTVIGCNTRRYHGLLTASLHPPVERVVALACVLETVTVGDKTFELANCEFSDRLHPQGYRHLRRFRQGDGVHFQYELEEGAIEKSIYLMYDHDVVMVTYDFSGWIGQVELTLMPLVVLRDFHGLQSSATALQVEQEGDAVTIHGLDPRGPAVHLYCRQSRFVQEENWWHAMHYREDRRRGQQDYEDAWAPGVFKVCFSGDCRLTLVGQATAGWHRPEPMDFSVEEVVESIRSRRRTLMEQAQPRNEDEAALVLAADQLVVRRQIDHSPRRESASILAGYHWFADWGRDTFIALPGVLLSTGRLAEAREVLSTFAGAEDQGMIPNRFDDYGGEPHYNSVDASLWFINAAYQYLQVSGDRQTFEDQLRHTCQAIVKAYVSGTRYGIHTETNGLLTAGDAQSQLTWMDARCNDVSFTPRYGKAVEVNALWINALRIMAATAQAQEERQVYEGLANKAVESFAALFWNDQTACLYDCVLPDGQPDAAIRPNQIFAASLPFACLDRRRALSVVAVVQEHLLTPYGLRSLSPQDSRYQGHYIGDQFQRDSAYHQGTVWGYLIGPFVEAFLKVHDFSDQAKATAAEMLAPLLHHTHQAACLGSVSEIFDGDFPHDPKGAIAQAWSVGELLRSKKMID